ncbi:MAG: DUF4251 domain-containing protein [Flavisolibacter sp.]
MKNLMVLIVASLCSFAGLQAQSMNAATVRDVVEARSFKFIPQTAFPMGGTPRQLTPGFDMSIIGDSLNTYLPYFGRAFTAPDPGEGGFRFISKKFSYKAKQRKKQSWEIMIEPDHSEVRQMILRIFENGTATLQVTSNNRQPIHFNGYIDPVK